MNSISVGGKRGQQLNIRSFAVRCDPTWPSTRWHGIYISLGNVPYIQFQSVGDFIPDPMCSKFIVGLQTSKEWEGVLDRSDSDPSGWEWQML